MTGIVYDEATKAAIEGAYVMASYRVHITGLAGSTTWCVKTRGMHTGKDGRYAFPVERDDGLSPFIAAAIKPGYYRGRTHLPRKDSQGKQPYEGFDLGLIPQKPDAPEFLWGQGDQHCYKAESRADAAAGAQFLRLERVELERLNAPKSALENISRMIERLESLPGK